MSSAIWFINKQGEDMTLEITMTNGDIVTYKAKSIENIDNLLKYVVGVKSYRIIE